VTSRGRFSALLFRSEETVTVAMNNKVSVSLSPTEGNIFVFISVFVLRGTGCQIQAHCSFSLLSHKNASLVNKVFVTN
jgi:hypothetical protein